MSERVKNRRHGTSYQRDVRAWALGVADSAGVPARSVVSCAPPPPRRDPPRCGGVQPASWSAISRAIASADVAAGDGALRTCSAGRCGRRRSRRAASRRARAPARARRRGPGARSSGRSSRARSGRRRAPSARRPRQPDLARPVRQSGAPSGTCPARRASRRRPRRVPSEPVRIARAGEERRRADQHVVVDAAREVDAEERAARVGHGVDQRPHEAAAPAAAPRRRRGTGRSAVRRASQATARRSDHRPRTRQRTARARSSPRASRTAPPRRAAGDRQDRVAVRPRRQHVHARDDPPAALATSPAIASATPRSRRPRTPRVERRQPRHAGSTSRDLGRGQARAAHAVGARRAARARRAGRARRSACATISFPARSTRRRAAHRTRQRPRAVDAQPRLQRARLVVDAGVDDAAVVSRSGGGRRAARAPAPRRSARTPPQQLARRRQPQDPGPDDDGIAAGRWHVHRQRDESARRAPRGASVAHRGEEHDLADRALAGHQHRRAGRCRARRPPVGGIPCSSASTKTSS